MYVLFERSVVCLSTLVLAYRIVLPLFQNAPKVISPPQTMYIPVGYMGKRGRGRGKPM